MNDVIIIGGGPAGVSAAIYLARLKRKITLIMKDYGTLEHVDIIENYYGFEEPIGGIALLERGIAQATRLGVHIVKEEVLNIFYHNYYTVKTSQTEYESKTVLLATGATRTKLRIAGFQQYIGKGISFCAICDGFLYRNKKIALIGSTEYMKEELEVLKNFTTDVTIFTNGKQLEVEVEGVRVVTEPMQEIKGDEIVREIVTANQIYPIDGIFVAVGTAGAVDFALKLGSIISKNNIVVDEDFMTNVPGLFAAGDCIGGLLQIATAVSDGAQAGISINKYLKRV